MKQITIPIIFATDDRHDPSFVTVSFSDKVFESIKRTADMMGEENNNMFFSEDESAPYYEFHVHADCVFHCGHEDNLTESKWEYCESYMIVYPSGRALVKSRNAHTPSIFCASETFVLSSITSKP